MSDQLAREPADGLGATDDAVGQTSAATSPVAGRSRRAVPPALRAGAPAWIWIGVAVSVIGFALIAVGWGQVAGETQVYLQMPYVVSAALVGLALVVVGLTVINIATRQRDAIDRDRQIIVLATLMEELKRTMTEQDRG